MKTIMKSIYLAFAAVVVAMGAVTANGAVGDLFVSSNGNDENGGGFIYEYTPAGVQTTFASGPRISHPRGLAFDSAGNLFVATTMYSTPGCLPDHRNVGIVLKVTPGGVHSVFATMPCDSFLEGLAIDAANNIFVIANSNNTPPLASVIFKITPGGVQSMFASPPSIQSFGLAFDSAGFLYAAVNFDTDPPQIWKFAPDGTSTVFATGSQCDGGFDDLAFDRFGNLFAGGGFNQCTIVKIAPDRTENTFATDLTFALGLAFDRAGNLFLSEAINETGNILKFRPNGGQSVFASLNRPEFLAFQLRPAPPPSTTPTPLTQRQGN